MPYGLGLKAGNSMPVEQWEAWFMELRESNAPDMPGSVLLLSDGGIAWLARQAFKRQERAIEVRLMEAEAYGPH